MTEKEEIEAEPTTAAATGKGNGENGQTSQEDANDAEVKATKRKKRLQRLARILLFLPYFVGIIWTCLHPIVSVITGELKCRGWYLDEHSIETRFTSGQNPQKVPSHLADIRRTTPKYAREKKSGSYSLCDFFPRDGDPGFNAHNLICHTHGKHFEVAMILPLSNAIDVTEEAIVLVVPSPNDIYSSNKTRDWSSSTFHQAIVESIKHLAHPDETPWLAKVVYVVAPTMDENEGNNSIEQTVSSFLDAYAGRQSMSEAYKRNGQRNDGSMIPAMPTRLSKAILRNLVVLDIKDNSTTSAANSGSRARPQTDLAILPQGRRGILPNADLVFLVGQLMERTAFYRQASRSTFLAHPYTQESKDAESWIQKHLPNFMVGLTSDKSLIHRITMWAKGLFDVSLFARTLAVGPIPPHAAALERGIDSLTVRVSFEGAYRRNPAVEFVQYAEYIVRSLANLHERLHHSFTLYLLPTPKTFVSHIEYLLPNILVLLPLAVRGFGILLPSMKGGMDLKAVGAVLLLLLFVFIAMLMADVVMDKGTGDHGHDMALALIGLYGSVSAFWVQNVLHRPENDASRTIRTLQYMACALSVYVLVPVAFAHASLAYLPSLLWSPIFAFPGYACLRRSALGSLSKGVFLPTLALLVLVTSPPFLLVPGVFATYTPFVRYAYVPVHILFFLLVTSVIVS